MTLPYNLHYPIVWRFSACQQSRKECSGAFLILHIWRHCWSDEVYKISDWLYISFKSYDILKTILNAYNIAKIVKQTIEVYLQK